MTKAEILTSQHGEHELLSRVKDILSQKYLWEEQFNGFRTLTIDPEVSRAAKPDMLSNPSHLIAAAQTEVLEDVINILEALVQGESSRLFQSRIFK
jgi:hypothetical protein